MADSTTVNYGWSYPSNGGDSSTWGSVINTTLVAIDTQVHNNFVNSVQSGGGQYQAALGAHVMALGRDAANSSVRVSQDGTDLGFLLRTTFGAGGNPGGVVTISTAAASGAPNDGDLWIQYS